MQTEPDYLQDRFTLFPETDFHAARKALFPEAKARYIKCDMEDRRRSVMKPERDIYEDLQDIRHETDAPSYNIVASVSSPYQAEKNISHIVLCHIRDGEILVIDPLYENKGGEKVPPPLPPAFMSALQQAYPEHSITPVHTLQEERGEMACLGIAAYNIWKLQEGRSDSLSRDLLVREWPEFMQAIGEAKKQMAVTEEGQIFIDEVYAQVQETLRKSHSFDYKDLRGKLVRLFPDAHELGKAVMPLQPPLRDRLLTHLTTAITSGLTPCLKDEANGSALLWQDKIRSHAVLDAAAFEEVREKLAATVAQVLRNPQHELPEAIRGTAVRNDF